MSESGSDAEERSAAPAFPPGRVGAAGGSGEERAQAALVPLERLAELPVREHAGVFEEVFSGLEATLASVEDSGESHGR
jgi:hypothetical protein